MGLLEEGLFVKVMSEKNVLLGRSRKKYRMTLRGLVALLQGTPKYVSVSPSDVRKLARNNEELLPVIFGKWHVFRDANTEDFAYEMLLNSVGETDDETARLTETRGPPRLTLSSDAWECIHRHNVYAFMLVGAWAYLGSWFSREKSKDDYFRWLDTIRRDKVLLQAANKEAKRLEQEAKEDVRFWFRCRSILEGKTFVPHFPVPKFDRLDPKYAPHRRMIRDYWRYRMAKAIEDDKSFPTLDDCLDEIRRESRDGKIDWLRVIGQKEDTAKSQGGTGK